MKHSFTKPLTTSLLLLSFTLLFFNGYAQIGSFCEDPDDIIITECGSEFDLCIDRSVLNSDRYADIYVTENDQLGIFSSCDVRFPGDVLQPKHGTIDPIDDNGNCYVRYNLDDNYVLIPGTLFQDSFDYVLTVRDTCNIPTGYCETGLGKIWTINSAYYGPDVANVKVYSKGVLFDEVNGIVPGTDFFVDGTGLPNSNSEWLYEFYLEGNNSSTPDFTASVHTSCSQDIFGVDFGWFRPLNGCVATQKDKLNCNVPSSNLRTERVQTRAINEVTTSTEDTTRVYIVYLVPQLLPIEISAFTGQSQGINNIIQWYVESAIGNDRMILQKSENAIDFSDVALHANVTAKRYDYIDTKVQTRRSYYRIKIVSQNGDTEYTRMITVQNKSVDETTIDVYPNPTNNDITFTTNRSIASVKIFSLTGQVIYNQPHNSESVNLSAQSLELSPGVYFAKIELDNGHLETRKINIIK